MWQKAALAAFTDDREVEFELPNLPNRPDDSRFSCFEN
jgi:hypothetical protein